MDNRDLISAGTGYLAGKSIANNMAYELRKYREELEEIGKFYAHYLPPEKLAEEVGNFILSNDYDGAFEFLNKSLKGEIVHDCQNQKEFRMHLSGSIENRRNKYRPFYAKIQREMPAMLEEMTAENLCTIMGVELLSPEALSEYHRKHDEEISNKEFSENVGLVFRAILIIGLIILMIVLSAQ